MRYSYLRPAGDPSEAHKFPHDAWGQADRVMETWRSPYRINIVQYQGEPLTAAQITEGFDLTCVQVAMHVGDGSPRLLFDVAPPVQADISARRLRLTRYAFNALGISRGAGNTRADQARDAQAERQDAIRYAVIKQLGRVDKYRDRGFRK